MSTLHLPVLAVYKAGRSATKDSKPKARLSICFTKTHHTFQPRGKVMGYAKFTIQGKSKGGMKSS